MVLNFELANEPKGRKTMLLMTNSSKEKDLICLH